MIKIAIYPDNYSSDINPEKNDSSSPMWAKLLEKSGFEIKYVDVRSPDILDQLKGCTGFMWRWGHFNGMGRIARRLLPVIEKELGLVVYPDQNTCWHYDDKIAQTYLLTAANIPIPKTWIWFDRSALEAWLNVTKYPIVLKLATGAGSTNVVLVNDSKESIIWVNRLFSQQLINLNEEQFSKWTVRRRLKESIRILLGNQIHFLDNGYDPQSGYAIFQEFLPDNLYDTRITVIGNRAYGYRRFNRVNDFRASGSGLIDRNPDKIDPNFIRLAFQIALKLNTQSCAIDGLYDQGKCVVSEISYTYVSWIVHECPGHWELFGNPKTGELKWIDGKMWPEEAQIEDFINRLHSVIAL